MKPKALAVLMAASLPFCASAFGQAASSPQPRHITLHEAVELALKHNHDVRLAGLSADEKQHAKDAAKASYYPSIKNDSNFVRVTDTQLIEIGAGTLGTVAGTPVPVENTILNQGGRNLTTSGTQLTQPITSLIKIREANDIAAADVKVARAKAQLAANDVALEVHEVYYAVLIVEAHQSATEARILAAQDLENESQQQVKFGASLEQQAIESRVGLLQAKQELLTTELQLADLKLKLNDIIGLPLNTNLALDPATGEVQETCRREECVTTAENAHPEVKAARANVEKAEAAQRLAKTDIWVPDVDVFARYSYTNDVPFLARNFGTFGVHFSYDLFDGGKKRAVLHERESQLAAARENLAKVTDEVELQVETALNRLERTRQMLKVSEEIVALRHESNRVLEQELLRGSALKSQSDTTSAQEFDAKAGLLQSQLDYARAHDEFLRAMGVTPQ
jgi:outer membrane protein TolC